MKPLSVQNSNSIIFQNDDREVKRDKSEMPKSRIEARKKIVEFLEQKEFEKKLNFYD